MIHAKLLVTNMYKVRIVNHRREHITISYLLVVMSILKKD